MPIKGKRRRSKAYGAKDRDLTHGRNSTSIIERGKHDDNNVRYPLQQKDENIMPPTRTAYDIYGDKLGQLKDTNEQRRKRGRLKSAIGGKENELKTMRNNVESGRESRTYSRSNEEKAREKPSIKKGSMHQPSISNVNMKSSSRSRSPKTRNAHFTKSTSKAKALGDNRNDTEVPFRNSGKNSSSELHYHLNESSRSLTKEKDSQKSVSVDNPIVMESMMIKKCDENKMLKENQTLRHPSLIGGVIYEDAQCHSADESEITCYSFSKRERKCLVNRGKNRKRLLQKRQMPTIYEDIDEENNLSNNMYSQHQNHSFNTEEIDDLPPGWFKKYSRSRKNRPYYCHVKFGTTWKHPSVFLSSNGISIQRQNTKESRRSNIDSKDKEKAKALDFNFKKEYPTAGDLPDPVCLSPVQHKCKKNISAVEGKQIIAQKKTVITKKSRSNTSTSALKKEYPTADDLPDPVCLSPVPQKRKKNHSTIKDKTIVTKKGRSNTSTSTLKKEYPTADDLPDPVCLSPVPHKRKKNLSAVEDRQSIAQNKTVITKKGRSNTSTSALKKEYLTADDLPDPVCFSPVQHKRKKNHNTVKDKTVVTKKSKSDTSTSALKKEYPTADDLPDPVCFSPVPQKRKKNHCTVKDKTVVTKKSRSNTSTSTLKKEYPTADDLPDPVCFSPVPQKRKKNHCTVKDKTIVTKKSKSNTSTSALKKEYPTADDLPDPVCFSPVPQKGLYDYSNGKLKQQKEKISKFAPLCSLQSLGL